MVSNFSFRNILATAEIMEIHGISVTSAFVSAKGPKFSQNSFKC
jgi:hypothetical protein